MQPEQQQRIMGYFIEEAKDHLNTIEQGLLNLQATIEDPEMVNELFRAAHSVKGGAAMLGLNSIQQVSHRMEDSFKILKEMPIKADQKLESLLLKAFDALQELLEQLQGPFGLTDETANATVAGVQPTFDELEQHLNLLAGEVDPDLITSMPTTGFLASDEELISGSSLDTVLTQIFGSDVPVRLREMLQLFKHSDSDATSRQQLQSICDELAGVGDQFNLFAWSSLIETARRAIADPNNPYRTLAPVVIRDIKQAQDLVLAGRSEEIEPCEQLKALAATLPSAEIAADADFAALLSTADDSDLDLELPELEDSSDDLLFGDLPVTSTTELDLSSDLDFGDSFGEAPLSTGSAERNGPEVGMAELNSLADLFEGEVPDLGSTWQEEEIVDDVDDIFASSEAETTSSLDDSTDFSDLLFDEPEPESATQTDINDLSDLFGDELADEEPSSDAMEQLFSGTDSADDLTDLLAISEPEVSVTSTGDLGEPVQAAEEFDPFAGLDLDGMGDVEGSASDELDLGSTDTADAPLDDLGALFAGMDGTDLDLADELPLDEDLFAASESEAESENPFAVSAQEPSAATEPVRDPWEDTAGETAPGAIAPPDNQNNLPFTETELTETAPTNASFDDLLSDDFLGEPIEELSDQGDEPDFSGLFESSAAPSQDSSDELLIEELTDEPLDLATQSWLSDAATDEPEASGLPAEGLDLELFTSEDDPFAALDTELSSAAGLEEPDLFADLASDSAAAGEADDLAELLTPETAPASTPESEFDLDLNDLDFDTPGAIAPTDEADVSLDLGDLGDLDSPSSIPSTPDLATEDLNLDFGVDLGDTPDEELILDTASEQSMEDLLGEMGLDSDSTDSLSEIPELSAEDAIDLDDPFAEDLAAIVGDQSLTASSDDLLLTEPADADAEILGLGDFASNTSEPGVLADDFSLDLADLDLPESPDDLSIAGDLALEEGLSVPSTEELEPELGFEDSSAAIGDENLLDLDDLLQVEPASLAPLPDLTDLDELSEARSPQTPDDDFADLGDFLGEPATSSDPGELNHLLDSSPPESVSELSEWDRGLDEAFNPDTADELDDLDSLLEIPSPEPFNELGDLDNLLDTSGTEPSSEFDDLDDLLDTSSAEPSSEFDDLDNLLGEAPGISDEFASLDNSLDAPALEANGLADLENFLNEGATGTPPLASLSSAGDMLSSQNLTGAGDFSDLEALLQRDDLPSSVPQAGATSNGSEFDELDDLLKDAEEKMGGSPTVPSGRGLVPQSRRPTRPGRVFSEQTMRVPVKHLDNLSNLVGELVVNRNSLEQDQERLRQSLDNLLYQIQQLSDVGQRMQDLYERSLLESSLLASRQSYRQGSSSSLSRPGETLIQATGVEVEYDPLEMDRFTGFHSLSQEMIELIVRVRESASDIEFIVDETDQVTRMFRQVTTQLQEGLTRSRMVPFAQTADRLPRAVRDIAMRVGKQAELVIEGRETLIDKMILEQLYDPMTHLVNNAITHGIESPEVRRAAGKSPVGRIIIRAFHQGNQTIISVSDDGAGIDVERVKAKAIEKGLILPAEARSMTRLDVYDLLFHAGFSTKDQADDFSGRGVGMDVVRTSLSEIRGVINTDSNQGKGTAFTIRLPLTLSISKALCCISDRARIAFPMDGVEDMLDVPKERIQTNPEGQPCLPWRDSLLPLYPLIDLLSYNRHLSRGNVYGGNQEDDISSIVVLRSAGNFLALQVDQVLGEQEIVIKQLEGPVPKPIGVAGATVLGDGRIMPIADVLELIDLAMGRIRKDAGGSLWDQGAATVVQDPAAIKTEPMVLIVDDSITVRELLSMTFNKVGYRVEQARDGQEAWEKLRSGLPCDIVFCDIEMPRMDGLELLSRIQKDPNLSHLPIAMLTSRGADRHRQMASSLGASGYFTKPYLEEALLDAAQRMLKGERLLS